MADDTGFICRSADAIYMLNGSHSSRGAVAELALAIALDLVVLFESEDAAPTHATLIDVVELVADLTGEVSPIIHRPMGGPRGTPPAPPPAPSETQLTLPLPRF